VFADHICIALYKHTTQRAFMTMHGVYFSPKLILNKLPGVSWYLVGRSCS